MILFLVGYAGSGKSSLGKRLARRLAIGYVDTDKRVEQMVGATIADIFHYEGEEYFRRSERMAVEAIVECEGDVVVATGGGLPTWGDNMSRLNECGTTIYLRRSPEQILARLSEYGRQKRPMFRGKSDEELLRFMHEQMALREPYYAAAKMTIDCTTMHDDDVVEYIANAINR
ncbi:MAG: shikimate kinase [Alistipes sp.]|nr:shikimate kinase [Alistipes sp.]MBR3827443.1 shikimate kinase [Alistipes sp.]